MKNVEQLTYKPVTINNTNVIHCQETRANIHKAPKEKC